MYLVFVRRDRPLFKLFQTIRLFVFITHKRNWVANKRWRMKWNAENKISENTTYKAIGGLFFTSFAQLKEKRGRFTTGTTMTIKSCKFKITFYSITTTTTNKPKKPTTQRETTAKQYVISILKISASQWRHKNQPEKMKNTKQLLLMAYK